MRLITTTLVIIVSTAAAAAVLFGTTTANDTHVSGGFGTHNPVSHPVNPAHAWVAVKADHNGVITSGGIVHDACDGETDFICTGSFAGSEYALDIGGSLGQLSRLNFDYAGQTSGATVTVDNNKSIIITARVADSGNFRFPARSACEWQRYDVRITYTDTVGAQHFNEVIGRLWVAHLNGWFRSVGTSIVQNASRSNPLGTGTIFFIKDVALGSLADEDIKNPIAPDKRCSTGPHTHLELHSLHNWGQANEWHSASGPDGYNKLSFGDHVHLGGYSHTAPDDSYSGPSSPRIIGQLGGWTTALRLADNPYYSNH